MKDIKNKKAYIAVTIKDGQKISTASLPEALY
jgi:hypothetical protein